MEIWKIVFHCVLKIFHFVPFWHLPYSIRKFSFHFGIFHIPYGNFCSIPSSIPYHGPIHIRVVIKSHNAYAQCLTILQSQLDTTAQQAICLQCTLNARRQLLWKTPNFVQWRCETEKMAIYLSQFYSTSLVLKDVTLNTNNAKESIFDMFEILNQIPVNSKSGFRGVRSENLFFPGFICFEKLVLLLLKYLKNNVLHFILLLF